jgi:uncharacterized protein YndB with AHSA1/START domain
MGRGQRSNQESDRSYSTTFVVDQSPAEVFAAINRVSGWWSGDIEGDTAKVGAEFTYRVAGAHYSRQKVVESVPDKRIVWRVTESDLPHATPRNEWTGTTIAFDIGTSRDKTKVTFTHEGLIASFDCYDACSNAWGMLVQGNLKGLIVTGRDQPNLFANI